MGMGRKTAVVGMLKGFKLKLSQSLPVSKMMLFGSMGVGKEHRFSDVDLIVVSKSFSNLNFRQRAAKMYDYWELDYPVDFLCYTPHEFNTLKRRQGSLISQAVKEGIEI